MMKSEIEDQNGRLPAYRQAGMSPSKNLSLGETVDAQYMCHSWTLCILIPAPPEARCHF